ncbi:MAG: site-specific integrase, partial [Alphaproteobacteria bacterium]|nr:site-specific integrase [Alphaproteobacteria bacterium]
PSVEEKHHACISFDELPKLLQAIDSRENNMSKTAMQLLALIFVRTSELIGAKWEEIDWNREEWNIPASRMKMKRPHMVPLSRQTLTILKGLQTVTGDKPYIFHSFASKSRHISNGAVLMALRRMGYQGRMTGHGFRSLASTILNEKGYPPDVIERQLAHEDQDKIRSAYNRAEYLLERKKMMQDYADILDDLIKDSAEKVIVGKFKKKM